MARPRRSKPPRLLTEVELELMTCLWELGSGTVRDVLGELPAERELAYTSVSTVLRVLEQKGMVERERDGQPHVFRPLVPKPEYESRSLGELVEKVFDGAPTALVSRLIDDEGLSRDELESMQRLLKERLR